MNMLGESLVQVNGVVDVSIVVPICFENPLRRFAVEFIARVLELEEKALIPVTAVLGAYHIATRYLKTPRRLVKKILTGLLETRSPALYPQIPIRLAAEALDIASSYRIESWDAYLVALARSHNARYIYTLDKGFERIPEIMARNPFPEKLTRQYHEYVGELLGEERRSTRTR